ncbi:hypothetical protein EJ05DRAFT_505976 [Pseudovirgaria hyperparasitica]|uniref:Uncharacterized protein n=1 Tax=Pseudovirgaria hyperparasitica TaxID=470096 RepID=A0A6A6VPG7_9PEZI|nr:uncharacterized protein EJ05DRAFT_505976 [Pseudovirgaria hyperparasitica]KAF2752512.1 hypothetical protein EJ05DRAFT_505976 [Pseudovirgaria hyperparasitica]
MPDLQCFTELHRVVNQLKSIQIMRCTGVARFLSQIPPATRMDEFECCLHYSDTASTISAIEGFLERVRGLHKLGLNYQESTNRVRPNYIRQHSKSLRHFELTSNQHLNFLCSEAWSVVYECQSLEYLDLSIANLGPESAQFGIEWVHLLFWGLWLHLLRYPKHPTLRSFRLTGACAFYGHISHKDIEESLGKARRFLQMRLPLRMLCINPAYTDAEIEKLYGYGSPTLVPRVVLEDGEEPDGERFTWIQEDPEIRRFPRT